jgi:hypothetical protein
VEANDQILAGERRAPARRLAAVAIAAIVLLLGLNAAQARAATDGPYAIHSMLQLNSPYGFKQAMFAEAAKAGGSEIRVDASLGALNNPWLSTAMWQGVDDYMELSEQYHLPVLIDLNASNDISLETCQPGIDPNTGLCGVTDLTGYYNEVAALVQHTRGVIDDFEVVNEPDGSWSFTGTPQQYAGMLATAYQAVHDNDPNGRVLLGGMMTLSDTDWLAAVFATPGFDAAHKFDIANVHLRDSLASLPGDVIAWRKFFTFFGDGNLPLWVTEAGYPSNPAWQYDEGYRGTDAWSGLEEQATFLTKALPAMLYAGAARVFVTERDDLSYEYASEGLLGGSVTDADENDPAPVEKPAYTAFATLAAQWQASPMPVHPLAYVPPPAPDPTPATTPAPPSPSTPPSSQQHPTPAKPASKTPPPTKPTKPAAKKPSARKPSARKPSARKPGAKKPGARKPTRRRHGPARKMTAHMARRSPRG